MTTKDYNENIAESARYYTECAREEMESENGFDCLEFTVFRDTKNPERYRAEFLLTFGGPTVRVEVDEYEHATFYHSWGVRNGVDCHEWRMSRDDEAFWVDLAQQYAEGC